MDKRKQMQLDNIKQNMSDYELELIQRMRDYNELDKESFRAKIMLQADALRRQRDKAYLSIRDTINILKDLQLQNARLDAQVRTGKITEQLKDNMTMTESEVKLLLQKNKDYAWAKSKDVINPLKDLAAIVGAMDPARKVILTEEEFEKYTEVVTNELKELGYEVFD